MELKDAMKYGEMATKAKKEIGKSGWVFTENDERVVLLYNEVIRLQEEIQFLAEQEAGASL